MKLYIVEFDDAKAALPFLNRVKDEKLNKLVPLATKQSSDLTDVDLLDLGQWFHSLGTELQGQAVQFKRAQVYLKAYLARSTPQALARKKAELLLADIERQLAKSESDDALRWIVLFRSANPSHWNSTVNDTDAFAIPLADAPEKVQYLRIRRIDTKEAVIIPMSRADLSGTSEGEKWRWNGVPVNYVRAIQFGIGLKELPGQPGCAWIQKVGRGWGFGHVHSKGGLAYAWAGKNVLKVALEIAVTSTPLNEDEKKNLLK